MIWREKRLLLIVLAVLLVANTAFFFTYRVQYQSRLDTLDERLAAAERDRDKARRERVSAEATLGGYKAVERDVQRVFDEYWSTQSTRLTALIIEVKRLALASSMQPTSYSFQQTEAKVEDAARRTRRGENIGVTNVGVRFAVDGTYAQVRRLINLLELSDQFVIIDQIALAAREGEKLTLSLHLSTLFRDETERTTSNRL